MSNFTTLLPLKPRFSKRFAFVLMGLHGGSILLLLPLVLPIFVKLFLGLLVLANALHASRKHLHLINHPLYGCILSPNQEIQLHSGQKAKMASSTYSHPQFVVLTVLGETLILWKDALDIETFRHLRVYLRHAKKS